jgi:Domain of unknown function (DUF4396)
MVPQWLHLLAIVSLAIGAICAVWIAIDEMRHPQHMRIMNLVWPITALYASVLGAAFYFRYGRLATHAKAKQAEARGETPPSKKLTSFSVMVAKGALHCGSGCILGDIIAEWLAFAVPVIAIWLGYQTLFSEKMFAVWILDMQIAMLAGFVTAYPVNWWLMRQGIKEKM